MGLRSVPAILWTAAIVAVSHAGTVRFEKIPPLGFDSLPSLIMPMC